MVVEQSFGVQIVRIHHILFELCEREKKERSRRTKSEFSLFNFPHCHKEYGALGVYFTLE